jgi:hypothetical protein
MLAYKKYTPAIIGITPAEMVYYTKRKASFQYPGSGKSEPKFVTF